MQQLWTQKQRKNSLLTLGKPQVDRDLQQDTLCLHCQPLNEVWEGVDSGSTPSGGPAFPPGAQSLVQAVT